MSVTPLFSADKYTYRLLWDEDKESYRGVCSEFPDLKYDFFRCPGLPADRGASQIHPIATWRIDDFHL